MSIEQQEKIKWLEDKLTELREELAQAKRDLEECAEDRDGLHAELESRPDAEYGPILHCGGWASDKFSAYMCDGSMHKCHRTIDEAIEEFRLLARMSGLA